jgi:hypothetical protein
MLFVIGETWERHRFAASSIVWDSVLLNIEVSVDL